MVESCSLSTDMRCIRSKIFAEIVAETLNSFVEPISYKAMVRRRKIKLDIWLT